MSRNQEDIANQLAGNQRSELQSASVRLVCAAGLSRILHSGTRNRPKSAPGLFNQNQGGILELFNMFFGGAWERMSILAQAIPHYRQHYYELLTMMWPQFQQWRKEGEAGRRKITRATRYLTLGIALIQGTSLAVTLGNQGLVFDTGPTFLFVAVLTLVTGLFL